MDDEPLRLRDPDEPEETAPGWKGRVRQLLRDVLAPLLLVLLAFWLLGQYRSPSLPDVAPTFALSTLEGKTVALASLQGQVVVLNFWATWCGPCKLEMPILRSFATANPDVPVLYVAVDGAPEKLRAFAEAQGLPLSSVLVIDAQTKAAYGVETLPTTVVVGPDGHISGTHAGVLLPGQINLMVAGN